MAQIISIKQVIEKLEAGSICELEWLTYNRQRKTGGEWLCHEVRLAVRAKENEATGDRQQAIVGSKGGQSGILRPANHSKNKTLNVQVHIDGLPQPQILTLHPILIMNCDGFEVI